MVKATLTLDNGTKVTLEGPADEVSVLLGKFGQNSSELQAIARPKPKQKQKSGPANFVAELIAKDFFKEPKELGSIKKALEEGGHYYPLTTLSPVLLRLVRQRELRRMKERKRWVYVN